MKILYISCHEVLEYDEVKLLSDLGHDVFSTGAYAYPQFRPGMKRPGLPQLTHYPDLERLASVFVSSGYSLNQELIDWADTIIFMHLPEAIEKNWEKIKHKRVIFRSIGQMVQHQEILIGRLAAEGLQIVRYSPQESALPSYAGANAMIRFYKDPAEYGGYRGDNPVVVNFSQSIVQRRNECHYEEVMELMGGFNARIYGTDNQNLGKSEINGGTVTYEQQLEIMRSARAYVYSGTWPAPYTLSFIEALMTGIPVVALGPAHAHLNRGLDFYEVHKIIQNGVNGFVSDKLSDLKNDIRTLLENQEYAREVGQAGRQTAIQLFGVDTIKQQWKAFL